jgi:hypothetical protein
MFLRIINLTIPEDKTLPEIISSFSPEENYRMLKIGCESLIEGRKTALEISQKEIYQKIKDESKDEIEKLELNILVERELGKKIEDRLTKIYEVQLDNMKKQNDKMSNAMDALREQIKVYELENSGLIQKEVEKVKEKCNILLQEKDNQNKLNREAVEKLQESVIKFANKSTSHKGSEGEKQFNDYAETFMDFKGFEIIDKHTQGGEGDFHLHFEEFDILADAKNYKKKVPIDQREKIKKDLLKNEHIHFGWLVSLNTSIDKWDKSPIMYEWINTTQCIVYINNLSCFEDPKKILRIVWYTCKELYKLIEDDENVDTTELTALREKQFKMHDKIKNIRKNIRELNTNINIFKNIITNMDDQLREILESETSNIVNSNFSLFDDWWEQNIEVSNESIELSTDLWMRFRQDKKELIKEMDIKVEKFKQFIKTKVPGSSLIVKSKNANSAFEIKGIKLKEIVLHVDEEIEIEFVDDHYVKKKKSKIYYYFNEKIDKQILLDYQDVDKDIMIISENNKIRPWEVISILIRHKVIGNRNESRGYDKYKETEEYKSKIKE